jgi:hypothetical protein
MTRLQRNQMNTRQERSERCIEDGSSEESSRSAPATTGGIARNEAIASASKQVETLREKFVGAIPEEIAGLEQIAAAGHSESISVGQIEAMLARAGHLLTLSGAFGFARLDQVVMRVCDLALGMVEKQITSVAPIDIHLRAIRLVRPGVRPLEQGEVESVLSSLVKIHAHYGIKRAQSSTNN